MNLSRRAVKYSKNPDTGFYCIESQTINGRPSRFSCSGQQWYRISTPQWLLAFWDTKTQKFSKPNDNPGELYGYLTIQIFSTNGQYFFMPRNIVNLIGNLSMYEYMIQNPAIKKAQLMKQTKLPQQPPGDFTCSVDPPCDYCACERKCAYNQKFALIASLNRPHV